MVATATRPAVAKGGPLGLANIRAFRRDPIAFLTSIVREQGDVARLRFGPRHRVVVVSHPDYVRPLLVEHWDRMVKWERQSSVAARVLGTGAMAILEGDGWRQNKRLVTPAFHQSRIERYVGLIDRHIDRVMDDWPDGAVIDMDAAMTRATMGVIGEILFDLPDFEHDADQLVDAFHTLRQMLMLDSTAPVRLPRWLPVPRFHREAEAMRLTDETLLSIIDRRRQDGEDRGDMLSMLLRTEDEAGSRLDDTDIRDSLMGLFIAGHETTAVLMTWALYLVAKHPEAQERLHAEATATAGEPRTLASLQSLAFTRQVLNEALRLYPPAWALFLRRIVEPIEVGPHRLEPGEVLLISPWIMHHRPELWDRPEVFAPERFEADEHGGAAPYAFIPFGGGPRLCAGARLAEMESALMLSALVRRFRFALADPDRPIAITPRFTVRPVDGMPVQVFAR